MSELLVRGRRSAVRAADDLLEQSNLSRSQFLLWLGQELDPDVPLYNMIQTFRIAGPIDPAAFDAAWQALVRQSDALRTTVAPVDGVPRRIVHDEMVVPVEVVDFRGADDPEQSARQWVDARKTGLLRPGERLWDTALLRVGDAVAVWYLCQHHLITDGHSFAVVYRYLAGAYGLALEGRLDEAPGLPPYETYLAHERRFRVSPAASNASAYWRAKLAEPTEPTPFYGATVSGRAARTDRLVLDIGLKRSERLREIAQTPGFQSISEGLSLHTIWATLLLTLLHRVTGRSALRVGTPFLGRPTAALRATVGLLIEIGALDVEVRRGDSFPTLARRVQHELMQGALHAKPGSSSAGLNRSYDVLLNVVTSRFEPFAGHPVTTDWVHTGFGDRQHALRLQVTEFDAGGGFRLFFDVHLDVFGDAERGWLLSQFQAVLDRFLEDPARGLGTFDLLDAEARRRLIDLFNATDAPYPRSATVVDLFEAQADATPGAVAVESDGRTLTYADLDAEANRIAHLLERHGAGAGARVALLLRRSPRAVAAILGVLKAGAAYVPIDPSYPAERCRLIVDDVEPRVVVTEGAEAGATGEWPTVDLAAAALDEYPAVRPAAAARAAAALAYVMFTSGSTGRPKGAMLTHQGLVNYLWWAKQQYQEGASLDFPLYSSLSFDLTLTSLFVPLISGGRVVVYDRSRYGDGLEVLDVFADDRVDIVKLTPTHLALLREQGLACRRIRRLIVGGENFRTELARAVSRAFGDEVAIFNEYGPTEAVVGCMVHRYDPGLDTGASVPIGRPAANARIHVLDEYDQPVPPGVSGEIVIGGDGVASGYWRQPELTGARFAADPSRPGRRRYRSGDLARWDADGRLEFLGRRDAQVKIRGARVEPGEIEAALVDHPGIEHAVVDVVSSEAGPGEAVAHCIRCGLASNYPGAGLDEAGVCADCRAYARHREDVARYFRTPADLRHELEGVRRGAVGKPYDCLVLVSGGKDSTYMLYQLVREYGVRPLVFTLDNGYIADEALANVRSACADLGVGLHVASTPHMKAIFADSLRRHANVCNGCFKTIYTLGMGLARERGIDTIVTGLSRGQLFETRLADTFAAREFDPERIDRWVMEARQAYHRIDDAVYQRLDAGLFESDAIFQRIRFIDFYRFVDVGLDEVYRYLREETVWRRPPDTGRSTNCLINDVGIYVHRKMRGFHNYALPYSWDVRLGHKSREAALQELDDDIDVGRVRRILGELEYDEPLDDPAAGPRLAAYYVARGDVRPSEARAHLTARLPAFMVPSYFVPLGALPLTANGKIDRAALPDPRRARARAAAALTPPRSETERRLCAVWAEVFHLPEVGVDDNFFDLGGDSIAGIRIVAECRRRGLSLSARDLFIRQTIADLAPHVDAADAAAAEGPAPSEELADELREPVAAQLADIGGWDAVEDVYPLTPTQLGMLYHSLRNSDPGTYFGQGRCTFAGAIDRGSFVAAWKIVCQRHPATRVRFVWSGLDSPVQVVQRHVEFPWEYHDWRGRGADEARRDLDDLLRRHREAGFDLNGPALMRFVLVDTDAGADVVWNSHHALLDGWSAHLLFDEVLAEYDSLVSGTSVSQTSWPRPFRDHVHWLATRDVASARQFWRDRLSDIEDATPLPLPAPFPGGERGHAQLRRPLDCAAGARVQAFARERRLTLSTFASGAWALLLSHYSGTDDVVFGSTVSGREEGPSGVDRMVGMLIATLPVRLRVDPACPVGEWLAALQRDALEAQRYGHLGLAEIQRLTQVPTTQPLFDSIVVIENYPTARHSGSLRPSALEIGAPSNYPLALLVHPAGPHGEPLVLEAVYDRSRLSLDAVARLLGHFEQTLVSMIDDADRPLGDVAVVTPAERADLRRWSDGVRCAPPADLVHERIASHATAHPDAVAVAGADRSGDELTYAVLERRSNQLAHRLRRLGVARGQSVGLVAGQSPLVVAAVQAILKAGAVYVPIDRDVPAERLAHIVRESGMHAVVAHGRFDLPVSLNVPVIDLATRVFDENPAEPPSGGPEADDLAYVIYTSGSTGTPKGVMVTHRNIAHSTGARAAFYGERVDSFLLLSSLAFDSSMVGLFWTLCSGGTLVLPPGEGGFDVGGLSAAIERHAVSHLLALPSLYGLLLDEAPGGRLRSLRTVIVAGEACPRSLVEAHRSRCPHARLVNEYGPTEGTVWSHAFEVREGFEGPSVPIGAPIPNSSCRVLDGFGHPAAVGVPGELWIGGPGVAAGYLARPDLTAHAFGPPPLLDVDRHERYYRTGDLVRWRADGVVEFLGRRDRQVKLRGYRVELEEVERILLDDPGIRAAAAVVTSPDHADAGRRRLVACYCADAGFDETAWRARLTARLPQFMLPAAVIRLDQLPATSTGKIDRRALVRIVSEAEAAKAVPASREPADAVERMLRDAFVTILGRADIGADQNFFDLGGNSIDAMRLFARIERTMGRNLRLSALLEAPTVAGLAAILRDLDQPSSGRHPEPAPPGAVWAAGGAGWSPLVLLRKGGARPPFFCVHGAGGNLLTFRDLALRLGAGQPVYGLEAQGADGVSPPAASVEEMASAYLAAIREERPGGPYLLGGYSGGGVVALELAQRMSAAGARVSTVVLLDTFHPTMEARKLGLADHVAGVASEGLGYLPRRARARAHRQVSALARDLRLRYYLTRGRQVPYDLREDRLMRHFGAISRDYVPRPYHGPVTLFRAREINRVYAHMGPRLGWDEAVLPALEVVEIPGDHESLFREPNIGTLARLLDDLLLRASREASQE